MRIVMNQYADGDKFVVETATDGSVSLRDLSGKRKVAPEFLPTSKLPATITSRDSNGCKTRWSICWKRYGNGGGKQ